MKTGEDQTKAEAVVTFAATACGCAPRDGVPLLHRQIHDLLSQSWPKSLASRRLDTYAGREGELPVILLLVEGAGGGDHEAPCPFVGRRLVGHAKLSAATQRGVLIESVIIGERERGKGVGKRFMRAIEARVRASGASALWLSTLDAVGFYESVGFTVTTDSVGSLGSLGDKVQALLQPPTQRDVPSPSSASPDLSLHPTPPPCLSPPLPPPPPPPPPPPTTSSVGKGQPHTWMKKIL